MKLIVGLGNPGESYSRNRHNIGVLFVRKLASFLSPRFKKRENNASWQKVLQAEIFDYRPHVIVARPYLFMNDSGLAVKKLVDYFKVDLKDLYIVHDDLDVKFGEFKVQKGKGPKLHNGVLSVEEELGEKDFWRVRVGVENRNKESKVPGEIYVLLNFEHHEIKKLEKVLDKIVDRLMKIIIKKNDQ